MLMIIKIIVSMFKMSKIMIIKYNKISVKKMYKINKMKLNNNNNKIFKMRLNMKMINNKILTDLYIIFQFKMNDISYIFLFIILLIK